MGRAVVNASMDGDGEFVLENVLNVEEVGGADFLGAEAGKVVGGDGVDRVGVTADGMGAEGGETDAFESGAGIRSKKFGEDSGHNRIKRE